MNYLDSADLTTSFEIRHQSVILLIGELSCRARLPISAAESMLQGFNGISFIRHRLFYPNDTR